MEICNRLARGGYVIAWRARDVGKFPGLPSWCLFCLIYAHFQPLSPWQKGKQTHPPGPLLILKTAGNKGRLLMYIHTLGKLTPHFIWIDQKGTSILVCIDHMPFIYLMRYTTCTLVFWSHFLFCRVFFWGGISPFSEHDIWLIKEKEAMEEKKKRENGTCDISSALTPMYSSTCLPKVSFYADFIWLTWLMTI